MRNKDEAFIFKGLTPAGGKIYDKSNGIRLVIYYRGSIRYYPNGQGGGYYERHKIGSTLLFKKY